MKKSELIDQMAEHAGITKTEAKKALEAFTTCVTKTLKDGDRLSLVGFGSFSVTHKAARTGRNPQTGAEIQISARNAVRFKAGADLTTAVN